MKIKVQKFHSRSVFKAKQVYYTQRIPYLQ